MAREIEVSALLTDSPAGYGTPPSKGANSFFQVPVEGTSDVEEETKANGTGGADEGDGERAALHNAGACSSVQRRPVRPVLYTVHFFCSWCERMFEYAIIVFLSDIRPGLALVSSYGLFVCLSVAVGGSIIGPWLDATRRLRAVRTISIARNAAIALCALASSAMIGNHHQHEAFLLVILHVFGAVAALGSRGQVLALEQDWVVVLARGAEQWLSETNAVMRRIDLTCDLLAPAAVGVLITATGSVRAVAVALAGFNFLSVAVEYCAMTYLVNAEPALKTRKGTEQANGAAAVKLGQEATSREGEPIVNVNVPALQRLRKSASGAAAAVAFYVHHPTAQVAFPLAMLYLTALSFGNVMIAWLRSQGEPDAIVGGARSACAALGFSSTLLFPWAVHCFGLPLTGLVSIWTQALCLVCGALGLAVLSSGGGGGSGSGSSVDGESSRRGAEALVAGVVLSRSGLWLFDLSVSQTIQLEVAEEHRGAFNGVQQGLQALLEALSYVAALLVRRPERFQWLVAMSCVTTAAAAALYTFSIFLRTRKDFAVVATSEEASREEWKGGGDRGEGSKIPFFVTSSGE